MSRFSTLPDMAGVLAWARKIVYGPGYRRARRGAFQRSRKWCQVCGLFRAEEATTGRGAIPLTRTLPPTT